VAKVSIRGETESQKKKTTSCRGGKPHSNREKSDSERVTERPCVQVRVVGGDDERTIGLKTKGKVKKKRRKKRRAVERRG